MLAEYILRTNGRVAACKEPAGPVCGPDMRRRVSAAGRTSVCRWRAEPACAGGGPNLRARLVMALCPGLWSAEPKEQRSKYIRFLLPAHESSSLCVRISRLRSRDQAKNQKLEISPLRTCTRIFLIADRHNGANSQKNQRRMSSYSLNHERSPRRTAAVSWRNRTNVSFPNTIDNFCDVLGW